MDFEGLKRRDSNNLTDLAKDPPESPLNAGLKGDSEGNLNVDSVLRSKSAHRLTFEAQVKVIKERIGDLEAIRTQLGLSQRKMTQLLMVDPSAWTRWTRAGEDAPPHIYRALQWYLALQEKLPGLSPSIFLPSEFYSRKNERLLRQISLESEKRGELESLIAAQSVVLEDQNKQLQLQVAKLKWRLNLSLGIIGSILFLFFLYKL